MNDKMFNIARILFFIGMLCALLIHLDLYQLRIEKLSICNVESYAVLDSYEDRNGYYHSDGFYCVWTKGMTSKEIMNNNAHERAHALVDNDYEHFCVGDKV